jgi:hypothetical protein
MDNSNNDPAATIASLGVAALVGIVVVWLIFALIAMLVAPPDRRWTFFWLTFLLFGPVGILAAAVASPRDPAYFAAYYRAAPARATPTAGSAISTGQPASQPSTGQILQEALLAKWDADSIREAEATAATAEARAEAARAKADELRRQSEQSKRNPDAKPPSD